jgi:hypothetical protein
MIVTRGGRGLESSEIKSEAIDAGDADEWHDEDPAASHWSMGRRCARPRLVNTKQAVGEQRPAKRRPEP